MAANGNSPKRRSVRLQRRSNEEATADGSGRRTSGPRTRLSAEAGGDSSGNGAQRRAKGQRAERAGQGGAAGGSTSARVPGGAQRPPEAQGRGATDGESVRRRRSRDGHRDDGSPPEKACGLTPSMVSQERSHAAGAAGSSQEGKEGGQENAEKSKAVARDVPAAASSSGTEDGGKAAPSIARTRTDVEEAGPSRQSASQDKESAKLSASSPSQRLVCGTKSPVRHADLGRSAAASSSAPQRDSKVHCTSKELLQEVLGMCAEFGKDFLESQNYLSQEQRQLQHRNFIWNFETAFQDNVNINGQPWQEAPDTASEPDLKILEDQLDDAIVDTAMKRKRYPRKILVHLVKGLKVEREILDQYKPVVQPKVLKLDARTESRMTEQTATTASISQQIKETMKALPAQLEKAEGFSQVLSLHPVVQGSRIRQDIFSSQVVLSDGARTVPKRLETTPGANEPTAKIVAARSLRRRQSPSVQNNLYPVRSKRKITLEG